MTDKMLIDRSVLEQASKLLQALSVDDNYGYAGDFRYWENYEPPEKLASTLRAALEQPQVEQEPVAEITGMDEYGPMLGWHKHWAEFPVGTKLYTHSQPPRQPLTDEWIRMIYDECDAETGDEFIFAFARAIERAHGIVGE